MSRPEAIALPWGEPNDLVWSPDGNLVGCATDDGAVHLVDPATGESVAALGDHDVDEVTAFDFGPGGSVVASTDLSSTVYLWSARTGSPLGQMAHEHGGHFLAYLADGRTLVSAGQSDAAALIDVESMAVTALLQSRSGELRRTAISADRATLATYTAHDKVLIWNLNTRTEQTPLRAAELVMVTCIALSSDGHTLATGSQDGSVALWSVADGTLRSRIHGHEGALRYMTFAPGSDLLATCGTDHLVKVWRTTDLSPVAYQLSPGSPGLMAWSPDGGTLALDAGAGELKMWARQGDRFPVARAD